MTTLYICEKPDVAKSIAPLLPGRAVAKDGYIEVGDALVTWCFGHLIRLAEPEEYSPEFKQWRVEHLPIVPDRPIFLPIKEKQKQLEKIGLCLRRATRVRHIGDPDREGQYIVDLVLRHFSSTLPVERIWLNALDDATIRSALAKPLPGDDFKNLSRAAQTRAVADWLVGMNLTRAYTLARQRSGQKGVLSIGRVQTPTLAMVVARDLAIEQFKAVPYFQPTITLKVAKGDFTATWQSPSAAGLDRDGRLIDVNLGKKIIADIEAQPQGLIEQLDQKEGQTPAPLPFSLSRLTEVADARYGLGAQQVLDIAQALYEKHKLTTYPRTDCNFLKNSQHADAPTILNTLKAQDPTHAAWAQSADPKQRSAAFNDSKVNAHHAIIPTGKPKADLAALSKAERQVYDLIVQSYIVQFLPAYQFESTEVIARVATHAFRASGRITRALGWKAISITADGTEVPDETETDTEATATKLPPMKAGETATAIKQELIKNKTKPPQAYTEGTLVKDMKSVHRLLQKAADGTTPIDAALLKRLKETAGIGTEATRASIIEKLKERDFLEKKGRKLRSTELARAFIDILNPNVKSPLLTALFEQELAAIEHGERTPASFLAEQIAWIRKSCQEVETRTLMLATSAPTGPGLTPTQCPACQKGFLTRRQRKDQTNWFWSCSTYPTCKNSYPDEDGKPNLLGRKAQAAVAT